MSSSLLVLDLSLEKEEKQNVTFSKITPTYLFGSRHYLEGLPELGHALDAEEVMTLPMWCSSTCLHLEKTSVESELSEGVEGPFKTKGFGLGVHRGALTWIRRWELIGGGERLGAHISPTACNARGLATLAKKKERDLQKSSILIANMFLLNEK